VSLATSIWSRVRGERAAHPGGRVHPGFIAAFIVVLAGLAGLVYGAGSAPAPAGDVAVAGAAPVTSAAAGSGSGGAAAIGDIAVRGAYIRQPAATDVAAVYMSITNTGSQPDTLLSVYSGAARLSGLYNVPAPGSTPTVQSGHQPSGPYLLAAGATVRLVPAGGHILLSQLTGPLRAGDQVSMVLTFQRTGQVLVEVPVIAISAPTPDGAGS
jgi:copper(I)-binding protein